MGIQVKIQEDKYAHKILNIKRLTLFTWCFLACCVVIFPIRCDFSDFFHYRSSTLKQRENKAEHSQSGQPAEQSQRFEVKISPRPKFHCRI